MRNIFLTIFIFFSASTYAQYSIKGNLVEKDTQVSIDFGNIILFQNEKTLKTTTPDEKGNFVFDNLTQGNYTIEIKIISFAALKNKIITLNKDINLGTIELSSESIELEGIEVVRQKQRVIYKLDKRVISAGSDITALGGNATDILSKVPSIRVDADGNVTFRGSSNFLIHVNGKPSMFNAALALQQIPASQIENIEIITTPSARDQASGESGIINIITKQQYGEGISGTVNVSGSTYASRGLDFTLTKQSGEHRFRFGGIYAQRFRKGDFEQEKTTIVADTSITSHSKGPRQGEYYDYVLQAGWQLVKPKTDYYVDVTGGYEGWTNKGNLKYTEEIKRPGSSPVLNEYNSTDDYDLHETLIGGTMGFNHKFKKEGNTLKGSLYLKYGGNALEYFKSDLFDKNNNRMQGHQAWEDEHRWTVDGKIDYILPYSDSGRVETGYQYNSYLEDGNYKMEYWNPATQQFDYRDDIYNTYYFQRGINSLYLLGYQQVKKFEFQVGVRAEHTHQVLESSKIWANRTQNRLEFFPSAHIGYNPNESAGFTVAYSRRTNRPELFFMEPYITFRDYYTAERGNPDIKPEYINSYELTFKTLFKENSVYAALFHRSRTDKIERLRIPYEAGITLDSMANVGNDYSSGAEFALSIKPIKRWSFVFNGNVYYYKIDNKLDLGGRNESSVNYGLSLNNNFQLAKYTTLQLDGSFIGPTVRTQGRQDGFFYTDLGLRQQFFAGKLIAGLSFRNFINSAKYISNIETDKLISHTTIHPNYPLITISLSYVFNNFKQNNRGREGSDFFEGTNY